MESQPEIFHPKEKVIPFGKDTMTERGLGAYQGMLFPDLSEEQFVEKLKGGILDVGSGASVFAVEAREKYKELTDKVYSVDVQDWSKVEAARERSVDVEIFSSFQESRRLGDIKRENPATYDEVAHKKARLNFNDTFEKAIANKEGYVNAYAQSLPFKDASFSEAITNFGPIYYLGGEETHGQSSSNLLNKLKATRSALLIISEMIRVVKPGGEVRITPLYNPESFEKGDVSMYSYVFHSSFHKFLMEALKKGNFANPEIVAYSEEITKQAMDKSIAWVTVIKKPEAQNDQNQAFNEVIEKLSSQIEDLAKEEQAIISIKEEIFKLKKRNAECCKERDKIMLKEGLKHFDDKDEALNAIEKDRNEILTKIAEKENQVSVLMKILREKH
jgi:ubiquinone/menaquinone biosynthesis C-methylase UbiE